MAKISVSYQALQNYFGKTRSVYAESVSTAEGLVDKTSSFLKFAENELDEINTQLGQLSQIKENAKATARKYRYMQNEYLATFKSYYNIAEQSNDIDEFYNYRRLANEFQSKAEKAGKDADNADAFIKIIEAKEKELLELKKLLIASTDELNENIEIEKNIGAKLINEINFNLMSLNKTIQSVDSYLSSSSITMPTGVLVSSNQFGTVGAGSSVTFSNSSKADERFEMKYKHYKLKSGVIDFKNLSKRPIYRVYNVHSSQIKQTLLCQMKNLHYGVQKEVLRHLDNIIFFAGKGGFIYNNNGKGKILRIVAIDASNPDYARNIFLHIGHQMYIADKQKQQAISEKTLVMRAKNSMNHANAKICQLSRKIAARETNQKFRNRRSVIQSADSKFFSECFAAYVKNETDYLNEIKAVYSESYKEFEKIISQY